MADKAKPAVAAGGGALVKQNAQLIAQLQKSAQGGQKQGGALAKENASLRDRLKNAARRQTIDRKDSEHFWGAAGAGLAIGAAEALAARKWDYYGQRKKGNLMGGVSASDINDGRHGAKMEALFATAAALAVGGVAMAMEDNEYANGAFDGAVAVALSRWGQAGVLSFSKEDLGAKVERASTGADTADNGELAGDDGE